MSENVIRVSNGEKYYNRKRPNEIHVIDNLNIELPSSGLVAIFGKSGCGKTTMLNVLGGLDKLNGGTVEIFGQDLRHRTDEIRNRYIGYVFQNYNLNNAKTVFENVADALRLCGVTDTEEIKGRVRAALANVDMEKFRDRVPDTLSGGQQQRVAIARALVKNPPILIADEPTGNLDEQNTVMVMDILKEISREHLVLLVTHEANLVDYYSDRVIEISDGRVKNVRENEGADGYVARNKNDVYLGELPMTEVNTQGVNVEYYGAPVSGLCLQIVNVNGKIYLKSSDPAVRLLDGTSEVHLKNGTFDREAALSHRKTEAHAMKDLPPLSEGKHIGRLYGFKNALVSAWRENFVPRRDGKKKKGRRLLRIVMGLLAVVLVFLSATFGVKIQTFVDIKKETSNNLFYLLVDPEGNYAALTAPTQESGIDYAYFLGGGSYTDSAKYLSFRAGNFITSQGGSLTANGVMLTTEQIGDAPLLAGKGDVSIDGDTVITSALADELIDSSPYSYIDSYEALIGLTSEYAIDRTSYLRIVGVVQGSEPYFYVSPMLAAGTALSSIAYSDCLAPYSKQDTFDDSPAEGTVYAINDSGSISTLTGKAYAVGDKIELLGKTFTVAKVATRYFDTEDYVKFVKEKTGKKVLTLDEYLASDLRDSSYTDYQAECAWMFDYFPQYLTEYAKEIYKNNEYYFSPAHYGLAQGFNFFLYLSSADTDWMPRDFAENDPFLTYDAAVLYDAYLYRQTNGTWPTSPAELTEEECRAFDELYNAEFSTLYDAYQKANESVKYKYSSVSDWAEIIVSDSDYLAFVCSVGSIGNQEVFDIYRDGEFNYYYNCILVHTVNPALTESYLKAAFDEKLVITPDYVLTEKLSTNLGTVIGGLIGILVVLASLCICVFFIMRSSFMNRIKEIGIERAIGVSKSNLIFKFGMEAALLTTLTEAVGFTFSTYILDYLSHSALFETVFYFPWWMGFVLIFVLYGFSLFFGILPALLLLRKTPSEILAKYDI